MLDPKIAQFVERIHKATLSNKLRWDRTADATLFIAEIPPYLLVLNKSGGGQIELSIRTGDIEIESITTHKMEHVTAETKLHETFDKARRVAFGVDDAIDDIMRHLES